MHWHHPNTAPLQPCDRSTVAPALVAGLFLVLAMAGLPGCGPAPKTARPASDPTSARSLPAGALVGFTGRYGSHVWRGIPFAEPPTGALRWRPPQPLATWTGVREAIDYGSPCPQLASPFGGIVDQEPGSFAGDEDCLYLNVFAPRMPEDAVPGANARLPVMVWLHGGGNSVGHAGFYDGGNLAQQQNVIVVATNYRLGPLGWFRHAALRSEAADPVAASGNFGNLDQIQALRWVRENIAGFGGDPDNVTLFGESAGARDTLALLISPLARGLFQRAIVQSGSARPLDRDRAENFADATTAPGSHNSSNEIVLRLLIGRGEASDRAAAMARLAQLDAAAVAALLRGASAEQLIVAYRPDQAEGIPDVPNVFGDGVVLPEGEPLAHLARANGHAGVPVIFGTNRDENKTFMFADPRLVKRWFGVLPRLRNAERYDALATVLSDAWTLSGADAPADALLAGGFSDVWVYRWDWDEEPTVLGADLARMIGAGHGFEIPFVFGHYDLGPRGNIVFNEENAAGRAELSAAMMAYWAEFARSGDPGRGGAGSLPAWTRWTKRSDPGVRTMILDTSAGGGPRMAPDSVRADQIIAAARADERLGIGASRCDALRALERRLTGLAPEFVASEPDCRTGGPVAGL